MDDEAREEDWSLPLTVFYMQKGISTASYWILSLFLKDRSKEDMRNEDWSR